MISTNTRTVTTTSHELKLTGKELIALVNQEFKAQGATEGLLPADADVVVWVPGGGNWSNTDLDINENPVTITWTERTEA